jgi:tyrosine-protein phosphatase SIW14
MRHNNAAARLLVGLLLAGGAAAVPAVGAPTADAFQAGVSIRNFGRINEQFYRGAQPKGRDFNDLATLGVKAVIDLTHGDLREEKMLVEQAGMRFYRLPMVTTARPSAETVSRFLAIVNDPANQPIYVHCAGGRHRTGVMTAAYRLTHDLWDADRAFAEMREYDFEGGWINHKALKSFVYEFHEQVIGND